MEIGEVSLKIAWGVPRQKGRDDPEESQRLGCGNEGTGSFQEEFLKRECLAWEKEGHGTA